MNDNNANGNNVNDNNANGNNVNDNNANGNNVNNNNANGNKLYISIVILFCSIGLIFLSWFFCLRHNPSAKEIRCVSYLILNDSTDLDYFSDTLYSLMIRADRIEEDINSLQNKYQSEVNLMVDKANGWLAFWIGVVALVMGLMSIWQMFRQNKNDSEIRQLKEETINSISIKYSEEKERLESQITKMQKKLNDLQQTLHASELSSLMMCLSNLPDPQMTKGSTDKKHQMCVILKIISNSFHEYVDALDKLHLNNNEKTYLVLTIVKLSIVRTHGVYSDIHQNIQIQHLIDSISNTNSEILNGKTSIELLDQIKKIESELHSLLSIIDR